MLQNPQTKDRAGIGKNVSALFFAHPLGCRFRQVGNISDITPPLDRTP